MSPTIFPSHPLLQDNIPINYQKEQETKELLIILISPGFQGGLVRKPTKAV